MPAILSCQRSVVAATTLPPAALSGARKPRRIAAEYRLFAVDVAVLRVDAACQPVWMSLTTMLAPLDRAITMSLPAW